MKSLFASHVSTFPSFQSLRHWVQREKRRRREIRELKAMLRVDNHLLRDIGLSRDDLRVELHRLCRQAQPILCSLLMDTLAVVAHLVDIRGPRPLFSENIVTQSEKVMFAFGAVVGQIHELEACRTMTHDLAVRHVEYGVKAEHFSQVGQAVVRTLEIVLDDDLTPDVEAVWRKSYDAILTVMVEATYPTLRAQPAWRAAWPPRHA